MKTIIISDLHNRSYWLEDALESSLLKPYDNLVFLGDYFDDFHDTVQDAKNAAEWLKQSIKKNNRIHLTGTHDIWYRFPYNGFISASGNTEEKAYAIRSILTQEDWNKLYLHHYEQNFLLSHAGVHLKLISDYIFNHQSLYNKYIDKDFKISTPELINDVIKSACEDALINVQKGYSHPWLDAGFVRKGRQPVGGITWLDWKYEFEPIPDLNQIVGHTELMEPEQKNLIQDGVIKSMNYNLDTKNRHIGILENGKFIWIENPFI